MNNRITIDRPCSQKWEDMQLTEQENIRHCGSCAINLIDFSKMTEAEIITYLAKPKKSKLCVRMHALDASKKLNYGHKQLLRWHKALPVGRSKGFLKASLMASLTFVLVSSGCHPYVEGEPAYPCSEILVADTTTTDVTDSVYVEVCN